MKTLSWFLKQFKGFSGIVFGLGVALMTLGIANTIPGVDLKINDDYRYFAVLSGLLFIIVGIILNLYYEESDSSKIDEAVLTKSQKAILEVVVEGYKSIGLISQDDLEVKGNEALKAINKKEVGKEEMFYRLEHLLKNGFITKVPSGYNKEDDVYRFTYQLSDAYRHLHGIKKRSPKPVVSPDENI